MISTRFHLKDLLTIVGVLALVLVALPIAAFLGVLARLPMLVAVLLVVVVMAVVAAFSPAFREWLNAEIDEEITFKGLRLATGIAMSPDHSWARIASDETWVGADDVVQAALGPVDDVRLPEEGQHVAQGEPLFTLSRGQRKVEVRSPISGTVVATNQALIGEPSLVNRAPFQEGWAVRIQGDHKDEERQRLVHGKGARAWFRNEVDRLLASIAPSATLGPALADGGVLSHDLYAQIDEATWQRLSHDLFGSARA